MQSIRNWVRQLTIAPATKDAKRMQAQEELDPDNHPSQFSHDVQIVHKSPAATASEAEKLKPKYQHPWHMKTVPYQEEAWAEVVAMSLWQMLDIHGVQPKTRIAEADANTRHILSKTIPEFKSLDATFPAWENQPGGYLNGVLNHQITGLGDIVIIALLLNEIDLKDGNIGTTASGRLAKVDGDCCFSRLLKANAQYDSFEVSSDMLDRLPDIDELYYKAANWLLFIYNQPQSAEDKVNIQRARLLAEQIAKDPAFRAEINQTLLRVIMLPNAVFQELIHRYIPKTDFSALLYQEILFRRDRLLHAALLNKSFQDYLQSREAIVHHQAYIHFLFRFNTSGKHRLLGQSLAEQQQWRQGFQEQLSRIQNLSKRIAAQPTDFRQLDKITFPILNLLDEPLFQKRSALVADLKKSAAAAHELGLSRNFQLAHQAAKNTIVNRVKEVETFVRLDRLACSVFLLPSAAPEEKHVAWLERQKIIGHLRTLAETPYTVLAGQEAYRFNPRTALSTLQRGIDNSFHASLDDFTKLDKKARPILAIQDRPEFPGRQKQVGQLKTGVFLFFNDLLRNHDLNAATLHLPDRQEHEQFVYLDKIALPILETKCGAPPLSSRQKALLSLKDEANALYQQSHNAPTLESRFRNYSKLSALDDQIFRNGLHLALLPEIFSAAEIQKITQGLLFRFQNAYLLTALPKANRAVVRPYRDIERLINEIADRLPPPTNPHRKMIFPLVRQCINTAFHVHAVADLVGLSACLANLKDFFNPLSALPPSDPEYPHYKTARERLLQLITQAYQSGSVVDLENKLRPIGAQYHFLNDLITQVHEIHLLQADSTIPAALIADLKRLVNDAFIAPDIADQSKRIAQAMVNAKQWIQREKQLSSLPDQTVQSCPNRARLLQQLKQCSQQVSANISGMSFDDLAIPVCGPIDSFLEFDRLAVQILSVQGLPRSSLAKLQHLVSLSYTHLDRPYRPLLQRLYGYLQPPTRQGQDVIDFYHSAITTMDSFRVGDPPFTSVRRALELTDMKKAWADLLNQDTPITLQVGPYRFLDFVVYTRHLLQLPLTGSAERQAAMRILHASIRIHYTSADRRLQEVSAFRNAANTIKRIDDQIDLITRETQFNSLSTPQEDKQDIDDWHHIALENLQEALNKKYDQFHENIDAFLTAANTLFQQIRVMKMFSSPSPFKQAAIGALQQLAITACQDPLTQGESFSIALGHYQTLCQRETASLSIYPWRVSQTQIDFNAAYLAYAQNPVRYALNTTILQRTATTIHPLLSAFQCFLAQNLRSRAAPPTPQPSATSNEKQTQSPWPY